MAVLIPSYDSSGLWVQAVCWDEALDEVERLRYAVAIAAAWLPGPERATVLDQARMTEDEAARLNEGL